MRGRFADRARGRREPVRIPLLSMALFAAVILGTINLATGGFLLDIDRSVDGFGLQDRWPEGLTVADVVDRIGQRAVCLPLMVLVAVVVCRRIGSLRPLLLAVAGTLLLNFVVGVIKLVTARESPRTGGPEFFTGNMLYPSGHSANVVFVYGLIAVLAVRYGLANPRRTPQFAGGVLAILVLMVATSVYRDTHWVTDLVVGGMVGGVVLEFTLLADKRWKSLLTVARRLAGPAWIVVEWGRQIARPLVVGGIRVAYDEVDDRDRAAADEPAFVVRRSPSRYAATPRAAQTVGRKAPAERREDADDAARAVRPGEGTDDHEGPEQRGHDLVRH